jgi:hypothetical protein
VNRSARIYRALTHAYPSRFRREYADEMTQLFTDRARRDGARRAWASAVRDLMISAPSEHRETFMHATPQTKLVIAAVAISVMALAALIVGGALIAMVLLLLLAWVVTAILRTRGHGISSHRWWKFAGAGVGVFVVLFVVFAGPWPESWRSSVNGEVAWSVAMLGFSTALVLIVVGALLGVAQLAARRGGRGAPV